ncbi:MAG: type II secretion system F family protein [Proteobacteria bacterium]|nr:MAG: type II secretion system F family protein [Pseudomonadota bacterium]
MINFAYIALGLAVYFMVRTVFSDEEHRSAGKALGNYRTSASDAGNMILKYARPFFSRYLVPIVEDLKIDDTRKIMKKKIASAGLTDVLTPDELYSFKLSLIIGFPVFLIFMKIAWEVDVPLYMFPIMMIIGYFYPDKLWLSSVITRRQEDVRRAMPFVVDLLALSTEAGLDFMGAIGKVVEKAKPSPLIQELETLLKEIKIGASRAEAMRSMAWRIDIMEVNSFVAVLISADEMGASIGKILRQQSEQIRHQRFIRAEKAGAKATQMILIPMMLFIMPAIFIIIFGPFILGMNAEGDPTDM